MKTRTPWVFTNQKIRLSRNRKHKIIEHRISPPLIPLPHSCQIDLLHRYGSYLLYDIHSSKSYFLSSFIYEDWCYSRFYWKSYIKTIRENMQFMRAVFCNKFWISPYHIYWFGKLSRQHIISYLLLMTQTFPMFLNLIIPIIKIIWNGCATGLFKQTAISLCSIPWIFFSGRIFKISYRHQDLSIGARTLS